jgi:hypothetical protein
VKKLSRQTKSHRVNARVTDADIQRMEAVKPPTWTTSQLIRAAINHLVADIASGRVVLRES